MTAILSDLSHSTSLVATPRPLSSRLIADVLSAVTDCKQPRSAVRTRSSVHRFTVQIPKVLPRESRSKHWRKEAFLTAVATHTSPQRNRTTGKKLTKKQSELMALVLENDCHGVQRIAHTLSTADLNATDGLGNTPLYYSSQSSLAMTQVLVRLGACVNTRCEGGNTPLHAAFRSDRDDVVLFLVKQGGELARPNSRKVDPMRLATPRICGLLGIEVGQSFNFSPAELARKLRPRTAKNGTAKHVLKKSQEIVLYQLPRSVRSGRLFLHDFSIRRNSPLYPFVSTSKLQFQGDCLSSAASTPLLCADE